MAQRVEQLRVGGTREIVLEPALRESPSQRRPDSSPRTGYERFGKPLLDRLLALVCLALFAPVMLATAAAITVQLGSPVLLRQKRIGLGGRAFAMYKFRTMQPDRRAAADRRRARRPDSMERRVTHKSAHDPRHTPLGRFLRKWSLDELPQLLNVLKGDMSLVGPRPELAQLVERYEPWQHRRHVVRPGITGLWQVTSRSRGGMMHEHTALDIEYAQHVSFRADMRMLLLTIPALLGLAQGE